MNKEKDSPDNYINYGWTFVNIIALLVTAKDSNLLIVVLIVYVLGILLYMAFQKIHEGVKKLKWSHFRIPILLFIGVFFLFITNRIYQSTDWTNFMKKEDIPVGNYNNSIKSETIKLNPEESKPSKESTKISLTKPKPIKTWNQIIDSHDSCNVTPMVVKEIKGISEIEAKEFLSSEPHLSHKKRFVTRKKDSPYLYWYSSKAYETWNKDEEEMRDLRGMKGNYLQLLGLKQKHAREWATDGYLQLLRNYEKEAFTWYNIRPKSPRIVLFHEYGSPRKPSRYDQRFRTFRDYEYHIFLFREEEIQSFREKKKNSEI